MFHKPPNDVSTRDSVRRSSALAAAVLTLALLTAAANPATTAKNTPGPAGNAQALASTPAPSDLRARVSAARTLLVANFAAVKARTGSAAELMARLDADLSALSASTADRDTELDTTLVAQLDASLVEQIVSGAYQPPAGVRGAGSLVFASSADKTMQPLAVYVPPNYDPNRPAPLIIMLHGQGQTENELLATSWLRALARETGAIFAAPYARGDDESDASGMSDVYDALSLLSSAYNVDRRRIYLSGFSLGGVVLFMVAPVHGEYWSALLSVAGTLTNDDKDNVAHAMRGKAVFLVAGSDDTQIRAQYVHGAANYLAANGVESRYYEQPEGVHSLSSLQPTVERAWRDMFSGVRDVAPEIDVPTPSPRPTLRT
jgi:predicted esterase